MITLLLTLAFIYYSAKIDYETLMYSYIYNHKSRAFQRALFFISLALYSITGAAGGVLLFMALFDATLNKLRGLDFLYLGNTAKWDKFFRERRLLYICVKVITLFSGIYLTLI